LGIKPRYDQCLDRKGGGLKKVQGEESISGREEFGERDRT